jgi:hypothetical protein
MKAIFTLALAITLFGLTSCDNSGRSSRNRLGNTSNNNPTPTFVPNNQGQRQADDSSNSGDSSDDSSDDSGGSTGSTVDIPSGATHCEWSRDGSSNYNSTHTHIGDHNICRGSGSNTNDVYLQLRNPISDSQLCLIPTHNRGTSTIYIGEPRCLMATEAHKIYRVILLPNRTGYQNLSITGTMIMKDKSHFYPPPFYQYVLAPDAYLFCSQFLDRYNDASYCTAFKAVGQYVYKAF